jgi:hypothetical protein
LHNDELHSPYSYPNIVRVIKSRRVWWAGHVARMGEGREYLQGFGWEARREETTWEDLGVGGRIIDLSEIGIDGTNWIQLAQDRV